METPGQQEKIGTPWIIAMIVLVVLLVLGAIFYARMGVRLDEPKKPASATVAPTAAADLAALAAWELNDGVTARWVELNTRRHTRV